MKLSQTSFETALIPSMYNGNEVTPNLLYHLQSLSAIYKNIARDGDTGKLAVPIRYANLIQLKLSTWHW